MLTARKYPLHVAHPSLLPLRMALILAESDVPPSPQPDANEQLALKLIQKIKTEQRKQLPVLIAGDIPSLYGYELSHAEIASVHAG